MKDLSLLVFLSQLGLGVALPLGGFVLLGVWLRQRFDLGLWVVIAGVVLGLIVAVQSLRGILQSMSRMARDEKEEEPPLSFNEHD